MAFPLISFAAGVAVGALAAYGYKDEDIRSSTDKATRWLYDTLAGAYQAVAGAVGGVLGSEVVSAEGPAATATPDEPAQDQPITPAA